MTTCQHACGPYADSFCPRNAEPDALLCGECAAGRCTPANVAVAEDTGRG